jgi:secernin
MCDTFVVILPDGVLFAKNSDRDPNEAQVITNLPRRAHQPGARVRCSWMDIPQVAETNAVLLSRPFWMWGAEMGTNEHGVTIGNEAVFTDQPCSAKGLTGMDLVRLTLERSDSAAHAVSCLVSLLETFGQGGNCGYQSPGFMYHNSFLIADTKTAYVVDTAGKKWNASQVHETRSISNTLSDPVFRKKHSARLMSWGARAAIRQQRAHSCLQRVTKVTDLFRMLRDHGSGKIWPDFHPLWGSMTTLCMHAGGMVASSQTVASWVSELRPKLQRHWATGTAAPCLSIFRPLTLTMPDHLWGTESTGANDVRSWWWAAERKHRQILGDPKAVPAAFFEERDGIEQEMVQGMLTNEQAWSASEDWHHRWGKHIEELNISDRRPWWLRTYWQQRNRESLR